MTDHSITPEIPNPLEAKPLIACYDESFLDDFEYEYERYEEDYGTQAQRALDRYEDK